MREFRQVRQLKIIRHPLFFWRLNIPSLIKNSSFSLYSSQSLLRKVLILWQFALQERFLLILAQAIFAVYLNKKLTQGQKAILIVGQDIFFLSECKHTILAKDTQNKESLRWFQTITFVKAFDSARWGRLLSCRVGRIIDVILAIQKFYSIFYNFF